jgi:hypothetical protein
MGKMHLIIKEDVAKNCYRAVKEKRGNEKENYETQIQEKSLRNYFLERSSIND